MRNTLLVETYPKDNGVNGYPRYRILGFPLPLYEDLRALRLDELEARESIAWLANGMKIEVNGAYGSVNIAGLDMTLDCLAQTLEGASEIEQQECGLTLSAQEAALSS